MARARRWLAHAVLGLLSLALLCFPLSIESTSDSSLDAAINNALDDRSDPQRDDAYAEALAFAEDPDDELDEEDAKDVKAGQLGFVPSHVLSFPLPSKAHSRCFYEEVTRERFPVLPVGMRGAWYASGGGRNRVDFAIRKLDSRDVFALENTQVLHETLQKDESRFVVPAKEYTTYSFCFRDPEDVDSKVVTFALHVGSSRSKKIAAAEHVTPLQRSVGNLRRTLQSFQAELEVILLRLERHMQTQDSTESRVTWLTATETICMMIVSLMQIVYVRRLVNRKQWV